MKQIIKSKLKIITHSIVDVTTLPVRSPTPVHYQLIPPKVLGYVQLY